MLLHLLSALYTFNLQSALSIFDVHYLFEDDARFDLLSSFIYLVSYANITTNTITADDSTNAPENVVIISGN